MINNSVAIEPDADASWVSVFFYFPVDGAPGCPRERNRAGQEHVAAQGHLHQAAGTHQGLPQCLPPEGNVSARSTTKF